MINQRILAKTFLALHYTVWRLKDVETAGGPPTKQELQVLFTVGAQLTSHCWICSTLVTPNARTRGIGPEAATQFTLHEIASASQAQPGLADMLQIPLIDFAAR